MAVRPVLIRIVLACAIGNGAWAAGAQQSTHEKTLPPPAVIAPIPAPEPQTPAASVEPRSGEIGAAATPLPPSGPVIADRAVVTSDSARTRLAIDLTGPVEFQVFRLTKPDRVVVDLTNVEFTVPAAAGRAGAGLVRSFRFGAFAPGKSRVVIETTGPVKVEATRLLREGAHARHRLEIELVPSATVDLTEPEVAAAIESVARLKHGDDRHTQAAPHVARKIPTIVIDPGHGGIDSGAEGAAGAEKEITLAVARELNRDLLATGRYRVVMTRTSDVYVSLDRRLKLSQQQRAQLFISLHTDSLEKRELAGAIRGATIYTLSQGASDEQARRLADKENAADLLAGAQLQSERADDDVKTILYDLLARETDGLALNFRQLMMKHMRNRIRLSRDPQRSANFVVLRQTETPAVLIELGFISHVEEEKQMRSHEWQRQVANAITAAIEDYFSKRKAIFR
ncbi:MAG: N-acetylmuramoyl-L-alanine amidase [Hyphomicrobiaceae bacterium]